MFGIEIDWLGLALPCAYLIVLTVSLMTFSSVYRKRKAGMLVVPKLPINFLQKY
jgi:hypothetical protein